MLQSPHAFRVQVSRCFPHAASVRSPPCNRGNSASLGAPAKSLRCRLTRRRAFCQAFARLLAVLGMLDLAREAPMQALEFRFGLAQVAWVLNRVPVRIGV